MPASAPSSVLLSAVIAATLTACGGGVEKDAAAGDFRPSTPAAAAADPATPADPEQAVLAQYRLFHRVVETALATNDPTQLDSVTTGWLKRFFQKRIRVQRKKGLSIRQRIDLNPRVTKLKGNHAIVHDCMYSHGAQHYDLRTGEPMGQEPNPVKGISKTEFTLIDETWKGEKFTLIKDGGC